MKHDNLHKNLRAFLRAANISYAESTNADTGRKVITFGQVVESCLEINVAFVFDDKGNLLFHDFSIE